MKQVWLSNVDLLEQSILRQMISYAFQWDIIIPNPFVIDFNYGGLFIGPWNFILYLFYFIFRAHKIVFRAHEIVFREQEINHQHASFCQK